MSEEQSRKNTLWNQKDLKNSILRVGSQIIYIIPNCDIHYVSTEIYPVWNVSVVLNKSKQYDRTGQWTSSGTVFFGQSKALELALGQQLAFWTPLPLFHQTCFHIIWKSVLEPLRHKLFVKSNAISTFIGVCQPGTVDWTITVIISTRLRLTPNPSVSFQICDQTKFQADKKLGWGIYPMSNTLSTLYSWVD